MSSSSTPNNTNTNKRARHDDPTECPPNYEIILSNPLLPIRHVHPYVHTYSTPCKQRWVGKTILDMFRDEFCHRGTYFVDAIQAGYITINGQRCSSEQILRNGDLITHFTHRHEPVVCGVAARDMIVQDDGDVLVVNKPASIPVHPSGAHRHNSVLHILKYELGLHTLNTVHRLDRVTSGLLLFTRTKERARLLGHDLTDTSITNKAVCKTYVAQVRGRFPANMTELHACEAWSGLSQELSITCRSEENALETTVAFDNDELVVCYPVAVVDHKRGIHGCDAKSGKHSVSRFCVISRNDSTSIVRCHPQTGRTHQLRLHLSKLGFPIVGDRLYGGTATSDQAEKEDMDEETSVLPGLVHLDTVDMSASLEERLKTTCGSCNENRVLYAERTEELIGGVLHLHALQFQLRDEHGNVVKDWRVPPPTWVDTVTPHHVLYVPL